MIRRVQLDLGPVTMTRLEALKARMEAASYAEVVRQALRVLEREMEVAEREREAVGLGAVAMAEAG